MKDVDYALDDDSLGTVGRLWRNKASSAHLAVRALAQKLYNLVLAGDVPLNRRAAFSADAVPAHTNGLACTRARGIAHASKCAFAANEQKAKMTVVVKACTFLAPY